MNALSEDASEVGEALQRVLVDLIDLSLLGKHAHWNVEGPHFRAVHLQLDEFVEQWRRLSDVIAERAITIGYAPDGQVGSVARSSSIEPWPAGPISDRAVIDGLTARLAIAVGRARDAMGDAAVRDSVTEDLLIETVATLEKQHWMLRAQGS
jgi:starvation-inducible DNA-binding protein